MKLFILSLLTISIVFAQSFNYNEQTAKDLAGFSLASYCRADLITSWNCGIACQKNPKGFTDVVVFKNSTMNAGGYLGYSKGHNAIVIAFRGTVPWSIKNWIRDVQMFKTKYSYCQNKCEVHTGFLKHFNDIKSQVVEAFNNIRKKYPQAKIFVTGHSLGAAMSAHALPVIYELNGKKPIDVFYNFGSPRVGDDAYAQWFNEQKFALESARITNGGDPVPHLPPSIFPFDYHHYDNEVFYKSFLLSGNKSTKCNTAEDRSCAKGVLFPLMIPDHISYFFDWSVSVITCQ